MTPPPATHCLLATRSSCQPVLSNCRPIQFSLQINRIYCIFTMNKMNIVICRWAMDHYTIICKKLMQPISYLININN